MKFLFIISFIFVFKNSLCQTKQNLIDSLQGTWQALDGNNKPVLRFIHIKGDSCFNSKISNSSNFLLEWDTSLILISNTCLEYEAEIYKPNKKQLEGEYINFLELNKYHNIFCYWYNFLTKDTLHMNYVESPKNYAIFIRTNQDIAKIKVAEIKASKAIIFQKPNISPKGHLEKFDSVQIIEEKNGWLRIRFYGKKVVEGWIKKGDLE